MLLGESFILAGVEEPACRLVSCGLGLLEQRFGGRQRSQRLRQIV